MQKTPFLLVGAMLLILMVSAACSTAGTGSAQPASGSASQPLAPSPEPVGAANQPAVAAQPANDSAQQPEANAGLAPVCQTANTCQAPSSEQVEIGCVDKIPYTNVLVPPATQFEVVDKSGDFDCFDSGTVIGGKTVLTCHGKELYSFDLKLSGSTCGAANLTTGTGQCQAGYGYDSSQQCCAPVSADTAGSTTVQVNLGGCPLPQPGHGG